MKKERRVLLSKTKIGEFLTIGVEQERDEIGLYIASVDVSASCAFRFKEWNQFIGAVNTANDNFLKMKYGEFIDEL